MLALMTLIGVMLGPLSYELYRARIVAQEAKLIREMDGSYWLTPHKEHFSARLAIRFWPLRSEFLARDIQGVGFGREEHELSPLARVAGLRQLQISGPVTFRDPRFSHPGIRSLTLGAGADGPTGDSFAQARVLTRFPQVEGVRLDRVPPSQALVDDLGGCSRLERLTLIFDTPFVPGQFSAGDVALVSLEPIGKLKSLRQLKVIKVARQTDWSFLAQLPELEEVSLSPNGTHMLGGTLESWVRYKGPIPPREQSPFHHLCELPSLKKVELYGSPAYVADIERLVANSPIEELRFDVLPDGLASIEALRNAKSLRRLHIEISYLGLERDKGKLILEGLPVGKLSLGRPYDTR
jgi:hypothetical protein